MAAVFAICTGVTLGQTTIQSTAVVSERVNDKVFLSLDLYALRGNLDSLFSQLSQVSTTSSGASSSTWGDVLGNGNNPERDVQFSGYDALGIEDLVATGTLTADSLILNKDAAISGDLNVSGKSALDSTAIDSHLLLRGSGMDLAVSGGPAILTTQSSLTGLNFDGQGIENGIHLLAEEGDLNFSSQDDIYGTFEDTLLFKNAYDGQFLVDSAVVVMSSKNFDTYLGLYHQEILGGVKNNKISLGATRDNTNWDPLMNLAVFEMNTSEATPGTIKLSGISNSASTTLMADNIHIATPSARWTQGAGLEFSGDMTTLDESEGYVGYEAWMWADAAYLKLTPIDPEAFQRDPNSVVGSGHAVKFAATDSSIILSAKDDLNINTTDGGLSASLGGPMGVLSGDDVNITSSLHNTEFYMDETGVGIFNGNNGWYTFNGKTWGDSEEEIYLYAYDINTFKSSDLWMKPSGGGADMTEVSGVANGSVVVAEAENLATRTSEGHAGLELSEVDYQGEFGTQGEAKLWAAGSSIDLDYTTDSEDARVTIDTDILNLSADYTYVPSMMYASRLMLDGTNYPVAGHVRYSNNRLQYHDGSTYQTLVNEKTKVGVRAHIESAQTIPSPATAMGVENWNEDVDPTNSFNPATGEFTAPRTGWYQVNFTFCSESVAIPSGGEVRVMLLDLAGNVPRLQNVISFPAGGNGRVSGSVSDAVYLLETEGIRPIVTNEIGIPLPLEVTTDNTSPNFGINRISITEF